MRKHIYTALHLLHGLFKKRYQRRLRVLAYHKVPDQDAFEKQVEYLKSQYSIIGIEDLLAHVYDGKSLPKHPLLITFDDGDISVLKEGLPVLNKYKLKSCLFVITGLINTSEDVWIKRIEAKEMKEGKSYSEARTVVRKLKQLSNKERLDQMKKYPQVFQEQLKSGDLKAMEKMRMFIGSHTHTHPMLDKCSSEEISEELNRSRRFFEEESLNGFEIFAYPNGNENARTEELLKKFGMKLVFLFDHKINKGKIDPLKISRIRVDSDTELKEFKTKVSGAHPFIFHLKNQ